MNVNTPGPHSPKGDWNETRIVKIIALILVALAGLKLAGVSCKQAIEEWQGVWHMFN